MFQDLPNFFISFFKIFYLFLNINILKVQKVDYFFKKCVLLNLSNFIKNTLIYIVCIKKRLFRQSKKDVERYEDIVSMPTNLQKSYINYNKK